MTPEAHYSDLSGPDIHKPLPQSMLRSTRDLLPLPYPYGSIYAPELRWYPETSCPFSKPSYCASELSARPLLRLLSAIERRERHKRKVHLALAT